MLKGGVFFLCSTLHLRRLISDEYIGCCQHVESELSFIRAPHFWVDLDEQAALCKLSPNFAEGAQRYWNGEPFGRMRVKSVWAVVVLTRSLSFPTLSFCMMNQSGKLNCGTAMLSLEIWEMYQ